MAEKDKYRATKLWNEIVRLFRLNMPTGRHRSKLRIFENSFMASNGVDWMHHHLRMNQNFGPDVTRAQTVLLLGKFHKMSVFEDARGVKHNGEPFSDNRRYFRFVLARSPANSPTGTVSRSPVSRRPLGLKNKPSTDTPKTTFKQTASLDTFNSSSDDTQRSSSMSSSISQDFPVWSADSAGLASFPATPALVKRERSEDLGSCLNSLSSGKGSKGLSSTVSDYSLMCRQRGEVDGMVSDLPDPCGEYESGNHLWLDITRNRLKKLLRVKRFDEIVPVQGLQWSHIRHNLIHVSKGGLVTNIDKKDHLPYWILSSMKCLASWPAVSVCNGNPPYSGFECDIFREIVDYFQSQTEPIIPSSMYNIFVNILVLVDNLASADSLPEDSEEESIRDKISKSCAEIITEIDRGEACLQTPPPPRFLGTWSGRGCLPPVVKATLAGGCGAQLSPRSMVRSNSDSFRHNHHLGRVGSGESDVGVQHAEKIFKSPLPPRGRALRKTGAVDCSSPPIHPAHHHFKMKSTPTASIDYRLPPGTLLETSFEHCQEPQTRVIRAEDLFQRTQVNANQTVIGKRLSALSSSVDDMIQAGTSSLDISFGTGARTSRQHSFPIPSSDSSNGLCVPPTPHRVLSETDLRDACWPENQLAQDYVRDNRETGNAVRGRGVFYMRRRGCCSELDNSQLSDSPVLNSPDNWTSIEEQTSFFDSSLPYHDRTSLLSSCLQLCLLLIPPGCRRRLHLLLRFMSKVVNNQAVHLDPVLTNLDVIVSSLSCCVIRKPLHGAPIGTVIRDVFAEQLTSFFIDNYDDVITVPTDLKDAIEQKIADLLNNQKAGSDAHECYPLQSVFCDRVTPQEYLQSGIEHSSSALLDLLDSILHCQTLSYRDKKKRLKQFKEAHPDVYWTRFVDESTELNYLKSLASSKQGVFNRTIRKLKLLRL